MTGSVLAALADPTRQHLLDRLAVHGAASATTLARELPVSRQAVVQHLGVLDAAGLVRSGRSGREVRFVLRPEPLIATATWLTELADGWERRLAAIATTAEEEGRS